VAGETPPPLPYTPCTPYPSPPLQLNTLNFEKLPCFAVFEFKLSTKNSKSNLSPLTSNLYVVMFAVYFFCLIICIALILYRPEPVLWIMLTALILIPLIGALMRLVASKSIRVSLVKIPEYARRGDTFDVVFRLQNRSIFPVTICRIKFEFWQNKPAVSILKNSSENTVKPAETTITQAEIPISGKSSEDIVFKIKAEHCLLANFTLKSVRAGFKVKNIPREIFSVAVIPESDFTSRSTPPSLPHDYSLSSASAESRFSSDSEFSGLREFIDGDRESRIHYKLSAKSEDVIVKEFSEVKLPSVLIICCPQPEFDADKNDVIFGDTAVFAKKLIAENIPVSILLYGYDFDAAPLVDYESVETAMAVNITKFNTFTFCEDAAKAAEFLEYDCIFTVPDNTKKVNLS
jgi:hypothetical protein